MAATAVVAGLPEALPYSHAHARLRRDLGMAPNRLLEFTTQFGMHARRRLSRPPHSDSLRTMTDAPNTPHSSQWAPLPFTVTIRDGREALIRAMTEDDAEEICTFLPTTHLESDFLNYLPGEFNKSIEEEKQFLRDHNAKPCSISMAAEVDGRIVGIAGALSQELARYAHHAECGLVVLKAFWNQGIGRLLMEHLVDWAQQASLRKLYLKVFADNTRAISLYRSLGFVEEARLEGDVLRGDKTYGDTVIMARFYV